MGPDRTVHVVVHGRVQGVGFRAWVRHQAELRGLEGWVRNRRDGTVEAMISGATAAVDAMLAACRRGPAGASVERVETTECEPPVARDSGLGRFEVLRTL